MPIELTNAERRTLDDRRSGDAYLWLIVFTHPTVSSPIRVARNGEDVTSNGDKFHKGWFDLQAPGDEDAPPKGQITVPNIDRKFSSMVLGLREPPRVRLMAVLRSDPDRIIEDYNFLFLRDIDGDAQSLSGTLTSWNFDTEPWPARRGTEDRFPGVFL
ncbi:MAG: DUF1833 family protein [Bradyrhizobium sp.]|uniref:DUF1833 family protein n=1 Tax=Bradyrhizobium sp. TaxID=376 RepID=UPI003D0E6F29